MIQTPPSERTSRRIALQSPIAEFRLDWDDPCSPPRIVGSNNSAEHHLKTGLFCEVQKIGRGESGDRYLSLRFLDSNDRWLNARASLKSLKDSATTAKKRGVLNERHYFPLTLSASNGPVVFASIAATDLNKEAYALAVYSHHGSCEQIHVNELMQLRWPGRGTSETRNLTQDLAKHILAFLRFKVCGLHAIRELMDKQPQFNFRFTRDEYEPCYPDRERSQEKGKNNRRPFVVTVGDYEDREDMEGLIQVATTFFLTPVPTEPKSLKDDFRKNRTKWQEIVGRQDVSDEAVLDTCMRVTSI